MTSTKLSRSEWAEGILALVTSYTEARETVLTTTDRVTSMDARQRCMELWATLGAALRSGTLPSPVLDRTLDEAFAIVAADAAAILAEVGPVMPVDDGQCLTVVGDGPTCDRCGGVASGVRSNHTLTEDAAAAASMRADAEAPLRSAHYALGSLPGEPEECACGAEFGTRAELLAHVGESVDLDEPAAVAR